MKRAIVLGGGGSKGAYHIGAWTALRQLNISYHIVTGTSIGAMNGALMVQQDYDVAKDLWDHMTIDQVMEDGLNLDISIDSFLDQKEDILPFIKNYINEKGANITPLREMMTRLVNYDAFYQSPIDYGLITTAYPSLKKVELTKKDLPKDLLIEYVIASGSCFPAFPIQKIHDKSYIDGGYSDNVPIDLAFKMGADEVIAIALDRTIKHPFSYQNPTITYIHSYHDLGTMLDFNEEVLKRNQLLGYYDTLKAFHYYMGYFYTFTKDLNPHFRKDLNLIEANLHDYLGFNSVSYLEIFQEYIKKPYLTELDFDIVCIEILASYIKCDPYVLYSLSHMNEILLNYFKDASLFHIDTLIKNLHSPKALLELIKEYEQSYIVGCIYHDLKTSHDFYKELNRFEKLSSKITLCALYLLSIDPEFVFPI